MSESHVGRDELRMLLAQKRVMNRLLGNVASLDAPVLIVQGARDGLVDPAGHDVLIAKARATGSAKVIVADGGHGSSAVENAVEPIVRWIEEGSPYILRTGQAVVSAGKATKS